MKELIYVDWPRIDLYLEQIEARERRGIRIDIEKISYKFPFEFGLTASASGRRLGNSWEKIGKVWAYIESLNAYHDVRPGPEGLKHQIIREHTEISEILLPSLLEKNKILFRFWGSSITRNSTKIILLLANNIKYADMPAGVNTIDNWSTYTALHRFLYEFRDEINQSTMQHNVPDHYWDRFGAVGSVEHPYFLSQDVNIDSSMISALLQNSPLMQGYPFPTNLMPRA